MLALAGSAKSLRHSNGDGRPSTRGSSIIRPVLSVHFGTLRSLEFVADVPCMWHSFVEIVCDPVDSDAGDG